MKYIISLFIILLINLQVYAQEDKKVLVATASMMADMAQNIAGDLVDVKYIVPRGQDPHLYKPKPSDVIMVEKSDLIIVNGLSFEGWVAKLIRNSGSKAPTITITDGINPIQSETYKNSFDPHAWMDVSLVQIYIDNIKDALVDLLPEHRESFEANHAAYSAKLKELDSYILEEIKKIPEEKRILITSHDAFAYYGRRYGLRLEAIMGISTEADVQSSDIIRVHQAIKNNNVPAVFMESTINPKILQQIAKDSKIVIGGELYADSLGDKDSPAYTYLGMLRYNTDTIVKGLTSSNEGSENDENGEFINSFVLYIILGVVFIIVLIVLLRRLNKL